MSSACTEFLSHKDTELSKHLIKVAYDAKRLYKMSKFENQCMIYYAGLLHDIGKLNPWYQIVFHEPKSETDAGKEYVRKHSVFSAWAARHLLYKEDYDLADKVIMLINGHHTEIKQSLGEISRGELFDKTHQEIINYITQFHDKIITKKEFDGLDWDRCKNQFCKEIKFDIELCSEESPRDFLDMSYAFSCLLQADRGSFSDWKVPKFDLSIETKSLEKKKSKLSDERTKFQEHVLKEFDDKFSILTINAPTGIGKTKVFLDLIQKCTQDGKTERVFYFSPLLALTEDFEEKIKSVISRHEDILIYNHLHSESLAEKNGEEQSNKGPYSFENESFNKEFIITTTHRLLMTIYSNKSSDKIKLASMRNSLLVIDEVQTIPKIILTNLKAMFNAMNEYMGTRCLLISATIPHEISDICRIDLPVEMKNKYLKKTEKHISFRQKFDPNEITGGRVLVMANTRKKAVCRFSEIQKAQSKITTKYISSGIRKKDRADMLKELNELGPESDFILVSTQVVEAGVDVNFSHIFREEAPLDNIIQVMGRLNREGNDKNPNLVIYKTDGKPVPYSPLEYKITQEKIKGIKNSIDIYNILEEYYKEISTRNNLNKEEAEKLGRYVSNMSFKEAWDFVQKALSDYDKDTVIVPYEKNWEETKKYIMSITEKNEKSARTKIQRKIGKLSASLPVSIDTVGREKFDEECMEKNIMLPKKECLNEIYDKEMGLDALLLVDR